MALSQIMRSTSERAESYRKGATELRDRALRQPENSYLREQLLETAADYEKMARRTEQE